MNEIIKNIEEAQMKAEVPAFNVGDTVRVSAKIKEGCRSLLGWQAVHTQQEARQCRQDSERLLPTWSLHFHSGRCTSAHRYRQTAACHRKHAEHYHPVWWRSPLRNTHGRPTHREG